MSNTFSPAKKNVIIICGPTASGKSDLALQLAGHFSSDIFSADSRQIYREMNIGTAKPDQKTLNEVRHHFVDHVSIHEPYSVGKYIAELNEVLEEYFKTNHIAIIAGGTGLYLNAFLNGMDDLPDTDPDVMEEIRKLYEEGGLASVSAKLKQVDPDYYQNVDRNNPHRIMRALAVSLTEGKPYSSLIGKKDHNFPYHLIGICLQPERKQLYQRIDQRVDEMIDAGLEDEVRQLYDHRNTKALQTVGYQELFSYLDGDITRDFAIEEIKKNSRRYAKRQMTWFRKYHQGSFFEEWTVESVLAYIKERLV